LLTPFLTELTEPLSDKLVHFALRCGSNEFAVRQLKESAPLPLEELRPFLLGKRRRELPTDGSKRQFESFNVWTLDADSAATILRLCPGGFHASRFEWIVYRPGYICMVMRPGMGQTYMNLASNQWEELFRLGLRFTLRQSDGKLYSEDFTEPDLPENRHKKLVAQYPALAKAFLRRAKTVDEVFRNSYGVMSFPPSYGCPRINPHAVNNTSILSWWSPAHDELLKRQIERDGYNWWPSMGALSAITDGETFSQWQRNDLNCLNRNWSDVLVDFARARALQQGLLGDVQWPSDARSCEICREKFLPSNHHPSLLKASPLSLQYCAACIHDAFAGSNQYASREECVEYVRRLAELLGRVPNSDFGTDWSDFGALDETNATDVLRLLKTKPRSGRVKDHFGSWLAALVQAGVLEDGTRPRQRGTQCLAKDGHVCLSIAEKTIDDMLGELGIPHEKEVPYPERGFRCDFFANGIYIEYFGLTGNPEYDLKTEQKLALGKQLGITILPLYPGDVTSPSKLRKRLSPLLSGTSR
jgi:hypothetical protein